VRVGERRGVRIGVGGKVRTCKDVMLIYLTSLSMVLAIVRPIGPNKSPIPSPFDPFFFGFPLLLLSAWHTILHGLIDLMLLRTHGNATELENTVVLGRIDPANMPSIFFSG
jgi:hypothetical protein